MKDLHAYSLEVSNDVVSTACTLGFKGDSYQLLVNVHPLVSNAMHYRDKELLEQERFRTVIALARVLDDSGLDLAIKGLGYQLTVKK